MKLVSLRRIGLIFLLLSISLIGYYTFGLLLALTNIESQLRQQSQITLSVLTAILFTLVMTRIGRQLGLKAKQFIENISLARFVLGIISIIIGLIVSSLLTIPVSKIPVPYSWILSIILQAITIIGAIWAFNIKHQTILDWFNNIPFISTIERSLLPKIKTNSSQTSPNNFTNPLLLDTSAIIDGRIGDIVKTGFLQGTLIVPMFIVQELQHIADSATSIKRQRGRKGLVLLQYLKKSKNISLLISELDFPEIHEIDEKLLYAAKHLHAKIITCDFNLNHVANITGVKVLNVNDLANTLKTQYIPGDHIQLQIIQLGKDPTQGVAYMPDGTMVVVENAAHLIDQQVQVNIYRVLQTAAGRMVFAKPLLQEPSPKGNG